MEFFVVLSELLDCLEGIFTQLTYISKSGNLLQSHVNFDNFSTFCLSIYFSSQFTQNILHLFNLITVYCWQLISPYELFCRFFSIFFTVYFCGQVLIFTRHEVLELVYFGFYLVLGAEGSLFEVEGSDLVFHLRLIYFKVLLLHVPFYIWSKLIEFFLFDLIIDGFF